jgi:hypothetical protein
MVALTIGADISIRASSSSYRLAGERHGDAVQWRRRSPTGMSELKTGRRWLLANPRPEVDG